MGARKGRGAAPEVKEHSCPRCSLSCASVRPQHRAGVEGPPPARYRYQRRDLPFHRERKQISLTDNELSSAGSDPHVNFEAPAKLRKWPSLKNQRRADGSEPYSLLDGTLDECLRQFMAKPAPVRHLYDIHISPQPPLLPEVLSEEIVAEVTRLREFL